MNRLKKPKVVHVVPKLGMGGGPAGYGNRLKQALEAQDQDEFDVFFYESTNSMGRYECALTRHFWRIEEIAEGRLKHKKVVTRSASIIIDWHKRLRRFHQKEYLPLATNINSFSRYCSPPDPQLSILANADLIIFHAVLAASTFLRNRKLRKQRVVVMPHSPTPTTAEIAEIIKPSVELSGLVDDPLFKGMLEEERRIYSLADMLVAPCDAALDSYRVLSPNWSKVVHSSRVAKCITGTPPPAIKDGRSEWRNRLNVNDNQILAVYIGRYHPHKGYDLLEPAINLVRQNLSIDLVLACAGGHNGSDNDVVRHVGYTDDPGGLMAAADMVVFPNRHAYFDLGVLECFSLGKPVLMTDVGGHRDLVSMVPGIRAVKPTISDIALGITEIVKANDFQFADQNIISAYEKFFSPRVFAINHYQLYKELLERPLQK
jgi:glycosyltransferase involved in cell wall biosynthesis